MKLHMIDWRDQFYRKVEKEYYDELAELEAQRLRELLKVKSVQTDQTIEAKNYEERINKGNL